MSMFERLFPKKGIYKEDESTRDALRNQEDIGIKGDVSQEGYINQLNKKVETRNITNTKEPVSNERSWEDEAQQVIIRKRFDDLNERYFALSKELKKKNFDLQELKLTRDAVKVSVNRLNIKELTSKNRQDNVVEQMRNAEDRLERLEMRVRKGESEILPYFQELKEIQKIIDILAGFFRDESIVKDTYNWDQN